MHKYICNSYKKELFEAVHRPTHNYFIALFCNVPQIQNILSYYDIEKYETSGQGYTKPGKQTSGLLITLDDDTAILSFDSVAWHHCSFHTTHAMLYNSSLQNKNAIMFLDFEKEYILNDSDFIVSFPPADKENGFIRII